jgi:hypothetical protein
VDGTGSGSCPLTALVFSGTEASGFTATVLATQNSKIKYRLFLQRSSLKTQKLHNLSSLLR